MALFSLAIAIVLWTIVFPVRSVKHRTRFDIPLESVSLNDSQQPRYAQPRVETPFVRVYAKVTEDQAKSFSNASAAVNLPPDDLPTGTNRFPVSIYPRALEQLVTQDGTSPTVAVTIDAYKKIDRVPIIPDSSGKLSNPSLVVDQMTIEPRTATIEGPASLVLKVKSIHATLPLEKVMPLSPAAMDVPLEAFDADNQIVSSDQLKIHPSTVLVTPKLSQTPSTKQLFVEAKFVGQVPEGYVVVGSNVTPNPITATGSSMALNRISVVQTQVIDVSQLTSSQVMTVQLVAPPNVHLDRKEVQVSIKIQAKSLKGLNPPTQKPIGGTAGGPGFGQ